MKVIIVNVTYIWQYW